MSGTEDGDARGIFPGDGEMSRRMREHPWAQTPMGAPASWPSSLQTACRICLTSRFPMIVWWGPRLRFLYNDAYAPLLGSNHPATGKPGDEVWPEIWHIIGPMLDSVMTTGQATWSEDLLLPLNRHGYLEETYWTYSYSPLHDDEGAVHGVFTAVTDTTERVVGERRLAALHDLGAQAGQAHSAAEACTLAAESLGRAEHDVPYAAVYLSRSDTGELDLVACSPAGSAPSAVPNGPGGWPLDEVLATGAPVTVTDVVDRFGALPAGGWPVPPTQAVALPLTGETGEQPTGVIVLAARAGRALDDAYLSFLALVARQTDALVNAAVAYETQQQRAEELAALDRAKTLFFSNISHEFRTPLTLIMGPVEELRHRLAGADERVRTELEAAHRNGLRLGKLVNTLLDFSRIESGRTQARFEPVDLAAVTADLASGFRSAIDKAGLDFRVECTGLSEPVYVDRGMWEKVVLNLLSNALKFTFDGTIRVETRTEHGHALVTVSDTGIGVPADEVPRLFERFHRIENVRARSSEGSGIGLALVHELVTLHGGTIAADSTYGRGTAFTIRLPFGHAHLPDDQLAPATTRGAAVTTGRGAVDPYVQEALRWLPDEPAAADDTRAGDPDLDSRWSVYRRSSGTASGARVLVADDNADMRDYLTRLLRAAGYEVSTAPDGQVALDAARSTAPDLIVSDVMMPRLDGLHLLAALRGDPRTASLPVLLLSARAGEESSIEGLESGADDYLVKPFSAEELLARVRANVELARLRTRHSRWRTALIDSLQEAFFVCDEAGAVVEVNDAFTDILGYGREDLPYLPDHPWLPDKDTYPAAHQYVVEVAERLQDAQQGNFEIPVVHRRGHQLWVAAAFSQVEDPDSGRHVTVGTFRDVTTEHYAIQRETALAALGEIFARESTPDEAVRGALEQLRSIWDAQAVTAALFNDSAPPAVTAVGGDQRYWDDLSAEQRTTLTALRDRPLLLPVVTEAGAAGVTLEYPAGVLALWIVPAKGRPFVREDQSLLALLAGRIGQGLHRVHRRDQDREAVLALQQAILGPSELPDGFAVRYEPAARPLQVGGDWYDTVVLPDGRIGIVVGDCVGSGLSAATVMGQLRSACRALLLQNAGPAHTLAALDRFAASVPDALCTTVFCGVLDPRTGALVYSSAGHPPGILAWPDGTTELLEGGRSLPLAVSPDTDRPEADVVLSAGATLLLYTDGLVERRHQPLDAGIGRAADALHSAAGAGSIDHAAAEVLGEMAPAGGYDDDVAVLVYCQESANGRFPQAAAAGTVMAAEARRAPGAPTERSTGGGPASPTARS